MAKKKKEPFTLSCTWEVEDAQNAADEADIEMTEEEAEEFLRANAECFYQELYDEGMKILMIRAQNWRYQKMKEQWDAFMQAQNGNNRAV